MKIFTLFVIFVPLLVASEEQNSVNITQDSFTLQDEFQNETQDSATAVFEDGTVQWNINAPKYDIKKAGKVRRGKVLAKLTLTRAMRGAIIKAHNRARSITKPTASNMLRITWDNALARTAVGYTRKCIYEHNPDPTHTRFGYIGENLFISTGLPFNAKLLDHAVRAWDQEKTVYNYYKDSCRKGNICGHYTQIVWADTFKIGCGVTRCGGINVRGRRWKNAILFACNYGPGGNYDGTKPYERGVKCKNCATGDRCVGKLCANPIRDRLIFNPKLTKWSPWSGWSKCSVSCGMGKRKRERRCNTNVPTDCKGFAAKVNFCMKKPCTTKSPNINFDIVLKPGDKLDVNSLMNLFNNGGMFRRTSQ